MRCHDLFVHNGQATTKAIFFPPFPSWNKFSLIRPWSSEVSTQQKSLTAADKQGLFLTQIASSPLADHKHIVEMVSVQSTLTIVKMGYNSTLYKVLSVDFAWKVIILHFYDGSILQKIIEFSFLSYQWVDSCKVVESRVTAMVLQGIVNNSPLKILIAFVGCKAWHL